MKSTYFALFILVVMFSLAILYYMEILNQSRLNLSLLICTVGWFGGLVILDFLNKNK
ncbi:hypothetical protein SAMN00777080_0108 [Aquiflexum balticum DSM 16537]|uniref:Uncharacterized protein n=1 Tax=Aquiflexum balticum DSM 16537 TaxID=758820 RepID=A0A1W2GY56_9BACT|nr:hypothetical protein SAMN00777080_0108 [Aquiflexum balticum DSM 16537]